MNECGYAFRLVGIDTNKSDDFQKDTLVYSFESLKSGHNYIETVNLMRILFLVLFVYVLISVN